MIRRFIYTIIAISLTLSVEAKSNHEKNPIIPPRPAQAIKQYIHHMVEKYQFNKTTLTKIINQAAYDPNVIYWIKHPFEKKPWNFYRHFFLRQDRIDKGVTYWKAHKKILEDAKAHYNIPPSIIIAIIGIESYFGQQAGRYNALNALVTLSFYYPKRAQFFKSELTNFLLLTRHEKLNPLILKGSYAGALGIPQFMPSSYRNYGVDYSKNHSIDLFTNHADVIASIANYLSQAGWIPQNPIATPAKLLGKIPQQAFSETAKPLYTLKQLHSYHIEPVTKEPSQLKAALIAMHNSDSIEYWLVFPNFYAIMRYNPRTTYALAVFELSRAIEATYDR